MAIRLNNLAQLLQATNGLPGSAITGHTTLPSIAPFPTAVLGAQRGGRHHHDAEHHFIRGEEGFAMGVLLQQQP